MIRRTLLLVPESTTTLHRPWNDAVPAVIGELEAAGYLEPTDGTLLAAANDSADGSITIDLKGDRFGQKDGYGRDYDDALRDRLEALADQIRAAHNILADVGDPDFALGGPGAPGTYLPDIPGLPGTRSGVSCSPTTI